MHTTQELERNGRSAFFQQYALIWFIVTSALNLYSSLSFLQVYFSLKNHFFENLHKPIFQITIQSLILAFHLPRPFSLWRESKCSKNYHIFSLFLWSSCFTSISIVLFKRSKHTYPNYAFSLTWNNYFALSSSEERKIL